MRRVAVTGMGIVSPIGNSIAAYGAALKAGTCGIGPITHFDASRLKVHVAAEVKDFDPLVAMEKTEVRRCDLYTRYALVAAHEAMAMAGLENPDPERFGVYVGSGIGGITTLVAEDQKLMSAGPSRVSPFLVPMMIGNMAAGHIAMRYKAQGPCLPVVTACATSTHAIGEAFRAIGHGYADVIIAGGAEAPIIELAMAGFQSAMALSLSEDPAAASLPFDKRREGFVMAEGAGILILEEWEHAVKRGADILCEVTGYGTTCDAHHITAPLPDGSCAARAIRDAAQQAGIQAGPDLYINTHGTGTQLNDKTETLAIKLALGDGAYDTRASSTKAMTGHMLGAAGAAEAIACILALRDGFVPPTIHLLEPDPECDLDYTPNTMVTAGLRHALTTSLGFGGHNACLAFSRREGTL